MANTEVQHLNRWTVKGLAELADSLEVGKGLAEADDGSLLRLAKPHAGVVELLVGLVGAVGVADLALRCGGNSGELTASGRKVWRDWKRGSRACKCECEIRRQSIVLCSIKKLLALLSVFPHVGFKCFVSNASRISNRQSTWVLGECFPTFCVDANHNKRRRVERMR